MALIPFDNCSNGDGPDDCSTLADVGQALAAAALIGLEPFIPEGKCGDDFHTYLSMGQPVAEFCDGLAVWLVSFGPKSQPRVSDCAVGVWPVLRANWRIELWENCYPTVDGLGRIPTPDELDYVNRHVYAHGSAAYNAVMAGWYDKTMLLPSSVTGVEINQLTPAGPQGGAVGWKFDVATDFG